MAKTQQFHVEGTDIDLYEVSKWNRRTIADGNWLNDNSIEPLINNDIILAKSIEKVEVKPDEDESINVRSDESSEDGRKLIYYLSVNKKPLEYVNSNNGASSTDLSSGWITFEEKGEKTKVLPLPSGSDHVIGNESIAIENDTVVGLLADKQYILSAEVIANVNEAKDQEYTVHITADTAPDEVYDFDFRIDGTLVHKVTKTVTWFAQNLDSVKLYMTSEESTPGISFSVSNIFCVEQNGGAGSSRRARTADISTPEYWIGNDGESIEVGSNGAISIHLPTNSETEGNSFIEIPEEDRLSIRPGIYQINAVIDVKLNDGIDSIAVLEVDFGDDFKKFNTVVPRIESGKYYSANFSFIEHVPLEGKSMSIKVSVGSAGGYCKIKHLSIAKIYNTKEQ